MKSDPITTIEHLAGPQPLGVKWKRTVLLLHGMGGHPEKAWGEREGSWYHDLALELEGTCVLSARLRLKHFSSLSEPVLERVSRSIAMEIDAANLLDRRLAVISHSAGGLLAKRLLSDMLINDPNSYFFDRRRLVRGVFFLGVPHGGSPWASKRVAKLLGPWRTETSKDLRPGSRVLVSSQHDFETSAPRYDRCAFYSFIETRPVYQDYKKAVLGPMVRQLSKMVGPTVPREFSLCGINGERIVETGHCHFDLPKKAFKEAGNLRLLTQCLDDAVSSLPTTHQLG